MSGIETMTSWERLRRAVDHDIPDRVPLDLGGFQTGIHKRAYIDLLDHLGMEDEVQILDPVQQLAKPCEQLLERFRIDTRYVGAHAPESFPGGIERVERNGQISLIAEEVAEIGVEASRAQGLPTVSAGLTCGYQAQLQLEQRVPIFLGGVVRSQIQRAGTEVDKAEIRIEQKNQDVRTELEELTPRLREANERIRSAESTVTAAQRALEITEASVENGLSHGRT